MPGHPAGPHDDDRDWRRSPVVAARRHWRAILIVALVCAAAAVTVSLLDGETYSASSKVLVESFESVSSELAGDAPPPTDTSRVVATQADLVTLPVVARRVRDAVGLPEKDLERIREATSVATEPSSDVITITSETDDRALSIALAGAFAEEFVRYREQIETRALVRARNEIRARLSALERAGRTDTAFYRQLITTREDLASRILLGGRNSSVVQPAERAEQTGPAPVRAGVVGGLAGLVIGLVAAWLFQLRDRRVRVETDASDALGGPPLARVPPISARVAREGGVAARLEPGAPSTEAYRQLATMLDLAGPRAGSRGRVVMLTSAGASEGKTSTILNLAVVLAEMGKRVAICDCDLRAPSVARRLRLRNEVGMTDVLAGDRALEAVVQHPMIGSLSRPSNGAGAQIESRPIAVVPSGRVMSNPARLLSVDRIQSVFDALRGDYDVVLVDSPAWMAVGDGLAISRGVDEVLCVVRQGATAMPGLARLAEALDAACAPVIGYVLVDWRPPGGAGRSYEYGRYPGAGDDEATSRAYALTDSLRPATPTTVTVSEAAALTGLSKATVRRRIESGSLPAVVRDGVRRIPVSELERQGLLSSGGAS